MFFKLPPGSLQKTAPRQTIASLEWNSLFGNHRPHGKSSSGKVYQVDGLLWRRKRFGQGSAELFGEGKLLDKNNSMDPLDCNIPVTFRPAGAGCATSDQYRQFKIGYVVEDVGQ